MFTLEEFKPIFFSQQAAIRQNQYLRTIQCAKWDVRFWRPNLSWFGRLVVVILCEVYPLLFQPKAVPTCILCLWHPRQLIFVSVLHGRNIRLKLAGPHPNSCSNKNGREGMPCVATTVDDRRDLQRKAETLHEQNKQTANSSLLEVSASHQTPHRRQEHAEESNHWKEGKLQGRNLPMPQSGRSRSNQTSQCYDDGKTTHRSLSRVSDHHSERDRNMRLEAIKERSSKGSVHPRVPSTDHVEKLAQEEKRLSKRRR